MSTTLISFTGGLGELQRLTPEELIVYVARVSNPENQMNTETAPKLLKYLIKNEHWSPFETVNMTVQIVTSRAISTQILRHRSFVFQEYSQRYTKALNYIKYPARRQDLKNRQNSIDDMSQSDKDWFDLAQDRVAKLAFDLYEEGLTRGIAKEQMRFLLPLNTETTLFMSGSIRSWMHYVKLRTSHSTQLEHRNIALEVQKIMIDEFPNISEAMGWK